MAPYGGSTEGPPKLHFGTPLTRIVALDHTELFRRSQWQDPHASSGIFHTPRVDRGLGPVGGSTKGPPNPHFGTPLTRIVALAAYGAFPKV